ncbi:MAG: AsmA family protein [Candidatus Omnitrophica bacterium]|nr:AsmA family protein [Candidatus Omnitrophota bacterium]
MRRLKKITFFVFVLISITTAGIVYLNTVFFPLQVKGLIIQKAKALLKRDVSIDKLLFHPGKGIVLNNIKIGQNNGDPLPLLTAKEISVSIPWPDIFWTGRVFIPAVTIQGPVIQLKYNESGQWNFSDLLALKESSSPSPGKKDQPPRFSIGSINIVNGQVTVADPTAAETISSITASAQIDILRNISFQLSFLIPSETSNVQSQGQFSFGNKELAVDIKAKNTNIPPLLALSKIPLWVEFRQCFLKKTDLILKFKDGEITIDGAVAGEVDLSTTETATRVDIKTDITSDNFIFKRKGPHFTLKGAFLAVKTVLTVDQNKVFTGTFKGNAIAMERNGDQFDLKGNLYGDNTKMTFNGQELTGNPQVENIIFHRLNTDYTISGQGKITNAALKNPALDLKAVLASGGFDLKRENADYNLKVTALSAEGINSLYANKAISGNVKSQQMTVNFANSALQTSGKFKTQNLRLVIARSITLLGNPDVELAVTRTAELSDGGSTLNYTGTMTLNNDRLEGIPKFDELGGLKGTISFNNDLAETDGLKATILGSPWELSGKVKSFKEPSVSITARSSSMDLSMIKELFSKKFKTAHVNITGTAENVVVKYESLLFSQEPPEISASGVLKSAEITAETIPQKVTGINGFVEYSTDTLGWKDLALSYTERNYSSSGSLKKFAAPDFKFTLSGENFSFAATGKTSDRIVSLSSFKGQFHQVPFDLSGTINLRGEIPELNFTGTLINGQATLESQTPFNNSVASHAWIEVNDIDLEKFKNCLPALENKNIAGNLSINTKLAGPLLDPNNWQGSGALTIKNGQLLEIELLKGVWKTLFSNLLVDDYKHIAFTQADANFKIASGRVSTGDLLLKSTSVDLSMKGWIGFNGAIDFDVVADVRQAPIVTSDAVKAVPTTIISQFAKNVVGFKLTGTLAQPQTKYKVLPLKVLKKTSDSVFLGIQGMMEDLLQ